jgi:hypothetical protein
MIEALQATALLPRQAVAKNRVQCSSHRLKKVPKPEGVADVRGSSGLI